jgi:hypothetical protein
VYLIRNGDSELPALAGKVNVTPVGLPSAPNLLRVTPLSGSELRPRTAVVAARSGGSPLQGGATAGDTPALREDCP